MSTMAARSAFDTAALREGIEERKASTLLSLYADDAEMRMIDHRSQPSHPMVAHGRTEITAILSDVYSRDMTHKLEQVVVDGDHVAWMESCRYPDGTRVLCSTMAGLKDGKIIDQIAVQAWDE